MKIQSFLRTTVFAQIKSVKKIVFIFVLTAFLSAAAFAQKDSATPVTATTTPTTVPADFKSDGCTMFPDADYGDCCVAHDKAYYVGGSRKDRWRADKVLYKCVAAKKGMCHRIIAPMMWVGVRVGGVPWLPTPFRWGFGRKKSKRNAGSVEKSDLRSAPPSLESVNQIKPRDENIFKMKSPTITDEHEL